MLNEQGEDPSYFAEGDHPLERARFVILGVPTDRTACHRKGTALAPAAIRAESWNFETHLMEYGVDLAKVPIHDAGDIGADGGGPELDSLIFERVAAIAADGKFPILIGGEHAITPPAVRASGAQCAVMVDAHFDYRRQYLDDPYSHACTTWRVAQDLGNRNVMSVGIRSMSADEAADNRKMPVRIIDTYQAMGLGRERLAAAVKKWVGRRSVYLSIDMDGVDPAYAPGVGTPEPFGLDSYAVMRVIEELAPRMVGFDLNEVFPPCDNGNTSALGARYIRSAMACVHMARTAKRARK